MKLKKIYIILQIKYLEFSAQLWKKLSHFEIKHSQYSNK